MRKIKQSIVVLVGCLLGALPAMAQTQTVTIKTSKAKGETMTLIVNDGSGASVNWGNGAIKVTTDTIVGTLASDSVVITGGTFWYLLDCSENNVTSIDITGAQGLTKLFCQNNELDALELLKNPNLEELNCSNNLLKSLPLSGNVNLTYLNCSNNEITRLTLTNTTKLETCICANNKIANLTNIANCTKLKTFWCQGNKLPEIRLGLVKLESLMCYDNELTTIFTTNDSVLKNLTTLICDNNKIKELNLTRFDDLSILSCDNNGLAEITLPKRLSAARKFYLYSCANNKMSFNDLPTTRSVTNMLYSPQADIQLPTYVMIETETVDLSDEIVNYVGTSVGKIKWYTENGTELTDKTDYTISKGVTTFSKAYPNVYALITSSTYPDLEMKTSAIAVLDPLGIGGVDDTSKAKLTCVSEAGGITVTAPSKTMVYVRSINGTTIWSGNVGTEGQFISLNKGIYTVNKLKVIVK